MITFPIFQKLYPLVNEIGRFSNSLTNEDSPNMQVYNLLYSKKEVSYITEFKKVINSYICLDILNCYFALGYHHDYDSNNFVLFDLVQYTFWFEKIHFSYEDFSKYAGSPSNSNYFKRGFNNAKRDINSVVFPILYIYLRKVDRKKGEEYILILQKIVTILLENQDQKPNLQNELINALLTHPESFLVSTDNNQCQQIEENSKFIMVTNQEEYEKTYLLAIKMVRFVKSLTNESEHNVDLCNYLESIGFEFNENRSYEGILRLIIEEDVLNCYFLLGYQQEYNGELYTLLDMIGFAFHIGDVPYTYNEFRNLYDIYGGYFREAFDILKNIVKPNNFPALFFHLSRISDPRSDNYICLLQEIVITLSKNQSERINQKDKRIDVLLSNPQLLLVDLYEDDEIVKEDNEIISEHDYLEQYDGGLELLKDKLFNGISFEIIGEEYHKGSSLPFRLYLRISNYNDQKKKISVDIKYISEKHGLKTRGGIFDEFVPDNSFVDLDIGFEDITGAYNGDRIEMEINEGKFASLRLIRERCQWMVVESIERSTYKRELKNKIEHFETIEEQFGITLQNFSIKVEDENSLKVFCEILALNGEIPENDFTINIAIYDNNNDIVYTNSRSKYAGEFKGFEVLTFDYIKLDITVDEISKIRLYPTL